ncbi:MAG: hypothetical protein M3033_14510 [Acidobacteriota bacterium]|nr:hypothetical protein [Acidobacteriota bacterium]
MRKFSIIAFTFLIFTFISSAFAQNENCSCNSASENDKPLGGNHVTVQNEGKVKQIRGITTFFIDDKIFKDVVVEVFEITKEEEKNISDNAWRIVENKQRKIGCITGDDGKFCFKNLQRGTYVLRIGTRTRDVEYFNSVYVVVKLNPRSGKNKEIKVGLTVAD